MPFDPVFSQFLDQELGLEDEDVRKDMKADLEAAKWRSFAEFLEDCCLSDDSNLNGAQRG